MHRVPGTVLWARGRREQLSFLHPGEIAVAFLARTLVLRRDEVLVRPRLQPLSVADGTVLITVTRIDTSRRCVGRRMTERAAHLVDEVLPRVPVRQWVPTIPYRIRDR